MEWILIPLWVALGGAWVGAVLAVPLGAIVLVVLGVRWLLRGRSFAPHDPRWISVYDVAAGVLLMLVAQPGLPRIAGAMLAVGAAGAGVHEIERVRALFFAFVAGLAVPVAPVVTLAVGISAGWRWLERA